jgi:hypothetical protein
MFAPRRDKWACSHGLGQPLVDRRKGESPVCPFTQKPAVPGGGFSARVIRASRGTGHLPRFHAGLARRLGASSSRIQVQAGML